MNFHVYNRELCIGDIQIRSVTSASLVLIGDTEELNITAAFDTPLDSAIISPLVPLNPQG